MPGSQLTDDDYRLVAAVAGREGWPDLARPPVEGAARTLAEQEAVVRFAAALPPAPRAPAGISRRHARMIMIAVGAAGLVACWFVSPERTLAALVLVGLFCLIGLRRRGRHGAVRTRRRGAHPMGR